jgi:hypothetical protein
MVATTEKMFVFGSIRQKSARKRLATQILSSVAATSVGRSPTAIVPTTEFLTASIRQTRVLGEVRRPDGARPDRQTARLADSDRDRRAHAVRRRIDTGHRLIVRLEHPDRVGAHRDLDVVPKHVVHPGLLGGWGVEATRPKEVTG